MYMYIMWFRLKDNMINERLRSSLSSTFKVGSPLSTSLYILDGHSKSGQGVDFDAMPSNGS